MNEQNSEDNEYLTFVTDKTEYFELLTQAFNDSKDTFDFTLVIEDKKIYCHKGILAVKSDYFRDLFKNNKSLEVATFKQGLTLNITKKIIQYIYGIEINMPQEVDAQLIEFMRHLHTLQIKDLKKNIATCCINYISNENVCLLYKAAYLYNEPELMNECFKYVLDNASCVFSKDKRFNFFELPYQELVRLIENDYLDIEEKQLIESVLFYIHKNVQAQIGDQEENSIKLGELLYTDVLNKKIRYGRMDHPEINELFQKNDYLKKIISVQEKNQTTATVFKLILEIQQYYKDGSKGKFPENYICNPRTDAIFKFSEFSGMAAFQENSKKPVEIRDYGFRIKRTNVNPGVPVLFCSNRFMMKKASFKIKILKGGFKSKDDDEGNERKNQAWLAIGLVDDVNKQEFQSRVPDINGKFVALYNSKGHVHLAYTNKNKLKIKDVELNLKTLRAKLETLKGSHLQSEVEGNTEYHDLCSRIEEVEEQLAQLNQESSYVTKTNEDRIFEGDVITVYVNLNKKEVSFYINKLPAFTKMDIAHLGDNLRMAVWLQNVDDSVVMVEAIKISSKLIPYNKYKELNQSDYVVTDDKFLSSRSLFEEDID